MHGYLLVLIHLEHNNNNVVNVQGSQTNYKSGKHLNNSFTFSRQEKIRKFEKNASNQG